MLSVFPELFFLGVFAPFILRVAVGVFFFYGGYDHLIRDREKLTKELTPRLGTYAGLFAVVVAVVEIAIGLSLIAGFFTQVVAILGMILALKMLWFKKKNPVLARHESALYWIVCVVLFSLLITGAGVFAIDVPL